MRPAVPQEVVGDDRTALEAVVAADAELVSLRQEEAEITARMGGVSLDEAQPSEREGPGDEGDDADADRLNAIYERLQVPGLPLPALLKSHPCIASSPVSGGRTACAASSVKMLSLRVPGEARHCRLTAAGSPWQHLQWHLPACWEG